MLGVVEELTGYAARPPQPLGYALPSFDETLLVSRRTTRRTTAGHRSGLGRNPEQ